MIFPGPTLCHHPAQYVLTHGLAATFLLRGFPLPGTPIPFYLTGQLFDLPDPQGETVSHLSVFLTTCCTCFSWGVYYVDSSPHVCTSVFNSGPKLLQTEGGISTSARTLASLEPGAYTEDTHR